MCGMRQGRAEYLLTLAALSTSTSDVQSKYSVWQRLRQRGSEAARRRHHEPDCQSVGQFVRSFSSSVVNGKPEVHPMFGVLLATATAPHPRRPHKALCACFSLECCEGEGGWCIGRLVVSRIYSVLCWDFIEADVTPARQANAQVV